MEHRARSMAGLLALTLPIALVVVAQAQSSAGGAPEAETTDRPPTSQPIATPGSSNEPPPLDPPGFTGPSGVRYPRARDPSEGFAPLGDRWRIGMVEYDRLGRRHPLDRLTTGEIAGNYPFQLGSWLDPYNQNVLKGDFPIFGQQTFLNMNFISDTLYEFRQVPTPSGESTGEEDRRNFFGDPEQHQIQQNFIAQIELFHGASAYKPFDWKFRVTPILNLNYLDTKEFGVVSIDVRHGTNRFRKDFAIQELFFELKLADLSPQYDFVSVRIGRQPFVSDFRGFIFNDINDGVRLFGNLNANRDNFNVVYFRMAEKETNSELNTFDSRRQDVFVVNYYRQDSLDFDFIPPGLRKGFTQQLSFTFNHDDQRAEGLHFDQNGFLTRPDAVGDFTPHNVRVAYFGWAGDGHIGRLNLTHQFYWALGRDTHNAIAGVQEEAKPLTGFGRTDVNEQVTINAQMIALEPSIDFDWFRLRTSFLWASGDKSPMDREARGFDGILENPNFAGGPFSYWNRQGLRLLNTSLKSRNSLFPDLSSSKIEGQSNFVNPGLLLANVGFDADVTPKIKLIFNANYLWFDQTEPLELLLKQPSIQRDIGADLSLGVQYRPLLNNNVIFQVGVASLIPGDGFQDLYERSEPLYQVFTSLTVKY